MRNEVVNPWCQSDGRSRDPFDLAVHGVIGLLAGGVIGFLGTVGEITSGVEVGVVVGASSLVSGAVAARFGDRFWGALSWLCRWI